MLHRKHCCFRARRDSDLGVDALDVIARGLRSNIELQTHTPNRAPASGEYQDLGLARRQSGGSGGFASPRVAGSGENGVGRRAVQLASVGGAA
jgi:hypothetical protein